MEIKYDDRIVAFIDVLGFSNLVYSDKLEPISHYYAMILTDFKEAAIKKKFKFLMISDSIVVHAPQTQDGFFAVIRALSSLQHRLLLKGILIRGGVSFGKLYVNETDNIIVGAGLINAYNLEKKAIYPRIVIDRNIIPLYWEGSDEFIKKTGHLIRHSAPLPYVHDYPFIDLGMAVALDFQTVKFQSVIKTIKDHYYNNDHIVKYEWLKATITEVVKSSLDYLNKKKVKSKNEPKRIKLLTDFLNEFEKV